MQPRVVRSISSCFALCGLACRSSGWAAADQPLHGYDDLAAGGPEQARARH